MQLHNYQKKIVQFCKTHKNGILSVDMGLGKTASILHYIDYLRPESLLIVAPKRVAETTWLQEAQKWELFPIAEKMIIVSGTPKKRADALADSMHPYKIISRDNLKDVQNSKFDLLILDELTSFKNPLSKRTKYVCSVEAWQKIGLTGTFLANGAIDIFGQCVSVDIDLCGGNFYAWRAMYFRDALAGSGLQFQKWKLRCPLWQLLQPFQDKIFTLSAEDYLSIPPVTEHYHNVKLSEEQMKQYQELDAFLGFAVGDDVVSVKEGAKFAKLQTLCNAFVYDEGGVAKRTADPDKLRAVAEFCRQAVAENEHILLFYAFREEAKWLSEMLDELSITWTTPKVKGFFEKWNSGDVDVLMAHPASAGHGLNLQYGGRLVVWSSCTYNYELFAQANARLARQGQSKAVQIHYFVADKTCEVRVQKALSKKAEEQGLFIKLTK